MYLPSVSSKELRRLEALRDAPLTDYPPPRWWGVWSRPYGDALLGVGAGGGWRDPGKRVRE